MPSAEPFEWPQGQPLFEVMWRSVTESLAGNGIVNNGDFEVTATATALEIQVAAGTYFYVGANHTLGAAETHTLSAGDGSNDRWDLVYFDTATDTTDVREGTPGTDPEPPDVTADEAPLAFVYVAQNASDVVDADILNWRAKFSNEAEEVHYDDGTGVYGVNNVDAALDELQEAAQITAYPLDIATDTEASAFPLANADLANSTIGVTGGTGISVTGSPVSLGGSVTIATDSGDVDLEFVRSADNSITATLATLPTNPTAFGGLVDAVIDSNSTQGTAHSYSLDLDGTPILRPEAESDGAGGIQNPRLDVPAPLALLAQSADPGFAGQGAGFYDTDDETPKYAESGGTYQRPLSRQDVDQFDKDETGTVNTGNVGVVWFTSIPDGSTLEVLQAGLLLDTLEPAPTDLDLVIYTGDNAGAATLETVVIDGDGTVKDDQTGSPLSSYTNGSGSATTVAMGVDNGNFNAGTGSAQDIATTFKGRIV